MSAGIIKHIMVFGFELNVQHAFSNSFTNGHHVHLNKTKNRNLSMRQTDINRLY